MRGFTVADLTPQCEIRLKAHYTYELLEQLEGAIELISAFSSEVWCTPDGFELAIDITERDPLKLRWRSTSETAGIATLRNSVQTFSISLLASGLNRDADQITLQSFQHFAVNELHDTGFEPSFDLERIPERPLIATVGLFVPSAPQQQWVFAMADRCFAAAYFRKLGLA